MAVPHAPVAQPHSRSLFPPIRLMDTLRAHMACGGAVTGDFVRLGLQYALFRDVVSPISGCSVW